MDLLTVPDFFHWRLLDKIHFLFSLNLAQLDGTVVKIVSSIKNNIII